MVKRQIFGYSGVWVVLRTEMGTQGALGSIELPPAHDSD